jgi:hypothetical protein
VGYRISGYHGDDATAKPRLVKRAVSGLVNQPVSQGVHSAMAPKIEAFSRRLSRDGRRAHPPKIESALLPDS